MDPFSQASGFMDLLTSQTTNHTILGETNPYDDDEDPTLGEQTPTERRGRRKWSPTEDLVLISAWLNTSKDAIVGNEQKGNTFWSRIATYYSASPKLAGLDKREPSHCKQRWQRINDQVCKFVGSYEAAKKEKSSGQNEDDVMKLAYQIFVNDYKVKFTLEHAWRELRHDQKWCVSTATKGNGASKRRKYDDHTSQSSSSVLVDSEEVQARPPGIKAAKAKGKRPVSKATVEAADAKLADFKIMWEIRQKDFALKEKLSLRKEKLSKHKLLESLLAKTEPLTEIEMALKNKLMTDMLAS